MEIAMKTDVLNVTGMTCGGCVASVKRALSDLPGVARVQVSLPQKQVEVQFDDGKVGIRAMREALQAAGYDLAESATGASHRGCG
jgi:copper chaperone